MTHRGPLWVILFQGTLFLQHVVEGRHRESLVRGKALFAVPVELLAEIADALPIFISADTLDHF